MPNSVLLPTSGGGGLQGPTLVFSFVGWGLFCASSWTWCIGMYLPIIMIRHFGWPGFLVFAIPNVLGCAGFGYACSRQNSEQLCREHSPAMVAFSAITIAYQVFFIAWLASLTIGETTLPRGWMAAGAALVIGIVLSLGRGAFWPALGCATTIASLSLWFVVPFEQLKAVPLDGALGLMALAYTAPIVVFGFLLNPWLDRTFHRARQSTPSVHAFGVFAIAFGLIILLTAAYSQDPITILAPVVVAHIAVQATFTIAAHARELRLAPWPIGQRARQAVILAPALLGALAADLPFQLESIYLIFLGFYALAFPAYVILFMRRTGSTIRAWPNRRTSVVLATVLVAALAPFAAIGFIAEKTWLLPVPVVILVVAAFLAPRALKPSTDR